MTRRVTSETGGGRALCTRCRAVSGRSAVVAAARRRLGSRHPLPAPRPSQVSPRAARRPRGPGGGQKGPNCSPCVLRCCRLFPGTTEPVGSARLTPVPSIPPPQSREERSARLGSLPRVRRWPGDTVWAMRWEARRPREPLGGLALPGRAFCAAFHVHPAGMLPPRGCPEPWGRGQGPGERAGPRGGGERDAWLRDPSARHGARPLPLGAPSPAQRAPPAPRRASLSGLPAPALACRWQGLTLQNRAGAPAGAHGPRHALPLSRHRHLRSVSHRSGNHGRSGTCHVTSPLRGVSVTRSFSPRKARVWTRAAVLFTTTPNVMGTARCPPTGDG